MDARYRIVYSGRLLLGHSHHEVVEQLARKFNMSEQEARELVMNGSGRVIKHDLSAAKAERYRKALASVGLEVDIEAQSSASGPSLDKPAASRSGGASRPALASRLAGTGGEAVTPTAVEASRGWGWIQDAWGLFKQAPWAWIGALLLFYLIVIVVSLVPLIGGLATTVLSPMLTAGLMLGAQAQDRGEGFGVGQLFAGFSVRPGPLALVGVVYLGLALLIGLVIGLLFIVMVGGSGMMVPEMAPGATMTPEQLEAMTAGTQFMLPVLIALLLGIPLAMAMFFAPVLVALDAVPVMQAFKLSFIGCLKNSLPFLVFGLSAFALLFVGAIPFLLGWLVLLPVLTIAVYTAYRDIFR
ncbi:MAG: BPSS1780 family membrane protein [Thermochromatium sp.]